MSAFELSTTSLGFPLVLGLGETGLAAANWLARHSVSMRVADTRERYQKQVQALCEDHPGAQIEAVLGENALHATVIDKVQTLIISPGLAITDPQVSSLLQLARQQGIRVISEIELFALALQDLVAIGYKPRVVAVTGTNGKTTVVQMVGALLENAGVLVQVAGNIGPAALTALIAALDKQQLPDIWVIELSSFQLMHTYSLPVSVATVLNISQDHLDWHGSMAAYTSAKTAIYNLSQHAVINQDDELLCAQLPAAIPVSFFGTDLPTTAEAIGVAYQAGHPWLAIRTADDSIGYLLPVGALRVQGSHNVSNALAALALTHALGFDWQLTLDGLRNYTGEPHRCQFVRSVRGVRFINDSKGTNVGATVAALTGLTRPVVLIAGGVAKGQNFAPLECALRQVDCRGVVLIGRDATYIANAITTAAQPIYYADTLQSAVNVAFALAKDGDDVLLSPACASLDMFENYMARGDVFVDAVNELALDNGEIA